MNVLNILKKHKMEIKEKYHVKRIGLFGSYARNEETEESDIALKHGVFGALECEAFGASKIIDFRMPQKS